MTPLDSAQLDQYRSASHDIWEAMSSGWEHERDFIWDVSRQVGERMVERLAPRPGETVLELAAGLGDTGFAAAAALGDDGRLICTDFAPGMVEAAQRHGDELGLRNADYRVLDAERMDLADESIDGVLCRWGYMLMADPAAALAETRRVLRPDGRVVLAVWTGPDRNPWAAVPGRVLVERGHMPAPAPGMPGIMAMADPDLVRSLVTGAGFSPPEIEQVQVSWRFPSFEEFWAFTNRIAGPLVMIIQGLPADERDRIRDEVRERLAGFGGDEGFKLPGETHVVTAR